MTDTKFTPGPLKVTENCGHEDHALFLSVEQDSPEEYRGATANVQNCVIIGGVTREEMFANANLYAASPELYEALYDCQQACLSGDDHGIAVSEDVVIPSDLFERICSALAKARGES